MAESAITQNLRLLIEANQSGVISDDELKIGRARLFQQHGVTSGGRLLPMRLNLLRSTLLACAVVYPLSNAFGFGASYGAFILVEGQVGPWVLALTTSLVCILVAAMISRSGSAGVSVFLVGPFLMANLAGSLGREIWDWSEFGANYGTGTLIPIVTSLTGLAIFGLNWRSFSWRPVALKSLSSLTAALGSIALTSTFVLEWRYWIGGDFRLFGGSGWESSAFLAWILLLLGPLFVATSGRAEWVKSMSFSTAITTTVIFFPLVTVSSSVPVIKFTFLLFGIGLLFLSSLAKPTELRDALKIDRQTTYVDNFDGDLSALRAKFDSGAITIEEFRHQFRALLGFPEHRL
jgi:hypothetical protein